jgi:predicted  nucleic acid-binding Zn-ribbon protein
LVTLIAALLTFASGRQAGQQKQGEGAAIQSIASALKTLAEISIGETTRLRDERDTLRKENEALKNTVADKQAFVDILTQKAEQWGPTIRHLENTTVQQKAEIDELRRQLEQKQAHIGALTAQKLSSEIEQLRQAPPTESDKAIG